MSAKIVGYGVYIPRYSIKYEEFEKAWPTKEYIRHTGQLLRVPEKAVPRFDEDSTTMAVEAAKNALKSAKVKASDVDAIIFGTVCIVYRGNPASTVIAKVLGCRDNIITVDINQSSRSGLIALMVGKALVDSGQGKYVLTIGSDCVKVEPGADPLEPIMGAGAGAFLLGTQGGLAEVKQSCSYVCETYDMWSAPEDKFLKMDLDALRFYYAQAVNASASELMKTLGLSSKDYHHVVFQQPSGREPRAAAKALGFNEDQTSTGWVVSSMGNSYSASTLIGLARVLDHAKKGEKILLVAYGSGCSDALHIEVTGNSKNQTSITVDDYLNNKIYIDYTTYLKYSGLLAEPNVDRETKPTLVEILNQNKLHFQLRCWTCKKCGLVSTIEQNICPKCYSQDWEDSLLPEIGELDLVASQNYVPIPIAVENKQEPVVCCTVNLGEGRFVQAQVVDYEGIAKVATGLKVEAVFRKYRTSPAVMYGYKFRPVSQVATPR